MYPGKQVILPMSTQPFHNDDPENQLIETEPSHFKTQHGRQRDEIPAIPVIFVRTNLALSHARVLNRCRNASNQ